MAHEGTAECKNCSCSRKLNPGSSQEGDEVFIFDRGDSAHSVSLRVSLAALSCSQTRDVCPGSLARAAGGDTGDEGHQLPDLHPPPWALLGWVAVPRFSGMHPVSSGNRPDCDLLPLPSALPASHEEQLIYSAGWAPLGCDLSFVLRCPLFHRSPCPETLRPIALLSRPADRADQHMPFL